MDVEPFKASRHSTEERGLTVIPLQTTASPNKDCLNKPEEMEHVQVVSPHDQSKPAAHMDNMGTPGTEMPEQKSSSRPARRPRSSKPNYRQIHRFPLPLSVYPLPPVIPHNPLSVLSVILSYLTYIIRPPQQEVYSAYFDSATSSVHVTDERTIRALWEMGFFGKGSLSRSEPTWLEREKKRRGLSGDATSEEATGKRRVERRELKLERARLEKEAIEKRLQAETAASTSSAVMADQQAQHLSANGTANGTANASDKVSMKKAREARLVGSQRVKEGDGYVPVTESTVPSESTHETKTVRFSLENHEKPLVEKPSNQPKLSSSLDRKPVVEETVLRNEEHLQLSNEEAFFLVYGLGALQVFDDRQKAVISTRDLFSLFRRQSRSLPGTGHIGLEPDDPFILSYAVYHHFRSLGWVVRSGVKFGVDYLLYNRGPAFSHAEFAIVVLPAYTHSFWNETEERVARVTRKQERSWWWLHCVNRVQAQVKKSLVLCYVDVPPPVSSPSEAAVEEEDIGASLRRYTVREISIKRWVPNRSRD